MRAQHSLLLAITFAAGTVFAQATRQAPTSASQFDPKEWAVPFGATTRPRDPFADARGRVWFVGQEGNYVAYIDSRTGEFKRYEIEAGTHPHNLVVEKGMVWFTGNQNGRIVRLDPTTGKLTIWKTGADTRPYGIVVDSKGQPWFDLFGTNKIGTIDLARLELKEYALPDAKAHPRRIAITSDDQLYWGDYTRGFLGHLDPATGRTEEWALPDRPQHDSPHDVRQGDAADLVRHRSRIDRTHLGAAARARAVADHQHREQSSMRTLALSLCVVLFGCAPATPASSAAAANAGIDSLNARISDAYRKHDPAAYGALYTDSAIFEWPAFNSVRGPAQLAAMAQSNWASLSDMDLVLNVAARRIAPDHATEFGAFEQSYRDSSSTRTTEYGRYVALLVRAKDGRWLMDRFFGFSDSTRAAPTNPPR